MQIKYIFSETGTGLRRNLSMTVALVVTIFVSLTLVGMGLLLNQQAHKTESYWGDKLQITVFMCNQNLIKSNPRCASGEVTPAQKTAVTQILDTHPEVKSYYTQSKQQAFDIWQRVYVKDAANRQAYSAVRVSDMQESYWVTLKDPNKFMGVETALSGMDGVASVRDLRQTLKPIYKWLLWFQLGALGIAAFLLIAAILQVSNTIRLAAFARRREISIMRLVGASNLYIQLPFLMETLVAAVVGILLACGALALFMVLVVYDNLRPGLHVTEWVGWADAVKPALGIGALGLLLAIIPTLLMTRKYLKV